LQPGHAERVGQAEVEVGQRPNIEPRLSNSECRMSKCRNSAMMEQWPSAALMGLVTAHERMANVKLRQAIALEAARLMYERVESEYYTAKRKAAKRLCRRGVKPEDLPSNAEIRDQIQVFARIHEGAKRTQHLRDMRLEAL